MNTVRAIRAIGVAHGLEGFKRTGSEGKVINTYELTRSMLLIDACSTRACSTNANASAVPFNKALLFFKQAKHRSHVGGFSQQYGVLLWRKMNLRWQAKDAGYTWVAYVVFGVYSFFLQIEASWKVTQ